MIAAAIVRELSSVLKCISKQLLFMICTVIMAQRIHVWEHFSVNSSNSSRVNCKMCNKSIARGGKQATAFNTSNMRTHMIKGHSRQRARAIGSSVDDTGGG